MCLSPIHIRPSLELLCTYIHIHTHTQAHTFTHMYMYVHMYMHMHTLRTTIRYLFVAFSLLGFVFFDMVYLSMIITYASQSELIQFYIMGIIDKVNTKAYSLEEAMKVLEKDGERERERERALLFIHHIFACTQQDIQRTYDYLRVMNGKLATLTTLCLLIFVEALISCKSEI